MPGKEGSYLIKLDWLGFHKGINNPGPKFSIIMIWRERKNMKLIMITGNVRHTRNWYQTGMIRYRAYQTILVVYRLDGIGDLKL